MSVLLAQATRWVIAALALSGIAAVFLALVPLLLPLVSLAPHLALTTKLKNRSAEMLLSVPYLAFVIGACNASRMTGAVPSGVQGWFETATTVVLVAAVAGVALPHLSAWRHRRQSGS